MFNKIPVPYVLLKSTYLDGGDLGNKIQATVGHLPGFRGPPEKI